MLPLSSFSTSSIAFSKAGIAMAKSASASSEMALHSAASSPILALSASTCFRYHFGSNYSTSRYKEVTNSTCSSAIRLSDTIWTRRSSQSFWLLATTTFLISSSFDNVSTCSRASSSLARPEASLFAEECSAPLFSASKAR